MTLSTRRWSALGLAIGYLADQRFGDPRRWHPVAGFGRVASRLEAVTYADRRPAGVVHVAVLVGAVAGLGWVLERLTARHPALRVVGTAAATWTVLGGRSLATEAVIISGQLAADDLQAARHRVRNLVGRETAGLSADEVARATVESLAENTSDAVVAPLFWGAVAGIPGLLGYRAVNTLDAMIGHRSPRYLRFGWAAARLDDVVNWLPARLAAVVAAGAAPAVGGTTLETLRIVLRDAGRHPSPNAGVVEAAFAGALGVRLGGRNIYHGEAEERGVLGDGRPVRTTDIARATRLAATVAGAAIVCAVVLRGWRP